MLETSNITYLKYIKSIGVSSFLQNKPNNFFQNIEKKKLNSNFKNINEVTELKDLEILIKEFVAKKFQNKSKKIVIGSGNTESKIMLIGDPLNEEEEKMQRPFVNKNGELLDKMLQAINLTRKNIYLSNIIHWNDKNNEYLSNEEIIECLPFIQRQIEIINPTIIVLLGLNAAKSILNSNSDISKMREKWYDYQSINLKKPIKCIVTYHPSYLIQHPNNKKFSWEDLKKIKKKINDENL